MAMLQPVCLALPHIDLAGYFSGPRDGAPAISLHGWLDNAGSFARLAPRLEGLRVLHLDLAGHGLSGHRAAGAGYPLWAYAEDTLQVAEHLGWQRFSLIGHSLGAIISVQLAAACPERVERLALIDGLLPPTEAPEHGPARLGQALRERLALANKRKPLYAHRERAIEARMRGRLAVSRGASELLAERGLVSVEGGYTWRSDSRLMLASPVRLTLDQALAHAGALTCPALLMLAERGILRDHRAVLAGLPLQQVTLAGGHHLHIDDDVGAQLVADCINRFFAFS
ncbi:alpha/beta fold hydrolase [Pseudomonas typographi]|uniref:Alpha/beta hydrolase n=1 Tax=Pseudomonas typographi TaxID=2715964 RepID=A0ABR7Z400_9PSED|nr:alpha/beta fold hydrolase [Pseudomonas typographi]MBD1552004.1 alpha/beta hydrolase [Pseudomonas typographi]MBD1586567.1 alpha/beta hydrolase [Pseudomonas typographi]MBD1600069.1 alpha/beta hydrolase [Pseudomonas typographi]